MSKKNSLHAWDPDSDGMPLKHDVFQAIADPTRRTILELLVDKEMPIASIAARFPMSRTAINKHLHMLSNAGLVESRRKGRETRYRANTAPLIAVQQWISFFEEYWDHNLRALIQYAEADEE